MSRWIVTSDSKHYAFSRIEKQKSRTVHWTVGLNPAVNEVLANMKARDRVLFLSSDTMEIEGELLVIKDAQELPRQSEQHSKFFREEGESKIFFYVPLKLARKFKHPVSWGDLESSNDVALATLPKIADNMTVYKIHDNVYRYALYMMNSPQLAKTTEADYTTPLEIISSPTIEEEEIKGKEKIGEGHYGHVYRAKFRHQVVAVKILKEHPSQISTEDLNQFKQEIDILRNSSCPRIIKFFGAIITDNVVGLVTELAENGELGALLLNKDIPLDLCTKLRLAMDIAIGMNWLHSSKPVQFLHRDLKPGNLLLDEHFRIKICDFGFCQVKDPHLRKLEFQGKVGTRMYMAPEILRDEEYCEKIDVYSFGMILWEIYTRERLFPEIGEYDAAKLQTMILGGIRPPKPSGICEDLWSLIERCWHGLPEMRPSFDQIVVQLKEFLLEEAISDPAGREFWKTFNLHGFTETSWKKFEFELRLEIEDKYEMQMDDISIPAKPTQDFIYNASDFQLNILSARGIQEGNFVKKEFIRRYGSLDNVYSILDDIELRIQCLKKVLKVDENNGKVTMKQWGDVLLWFGPLYDDNHYPGFLERITRTLKMEFFFGTFSETAAANLLKDKPIHYFLLRFSGKPGFFSLTNVTNQGKVLSRRIQYCVDEQIFVYKKQRFFSLEAIINGLRSIENSQVRIPCTGGIFSNLFAPDASMGYVVEQTEMMPMDI